MNIAMIGTGYVGLVSGACFADFGHSVVCVDSDPRRVECLDGGEVPFYEPGLAELVQRNTAAGWNVARTNGATFEGIRRPWSTLTAHRRCR